MSTQNSDLIKDSRLPTTFVPQGTQHTVWVPSRGARRRPTRRTETWQRVKELGRGSFGDVWLERCTTDSRSGQVRALKAIRKDHSLPVVNYERELQAAAKFSHALYVHCFVQSFGWFEDSRHVYLAMEYLEHGDLRNFIGRAFPEDEAKKITRQVTEGLVFMHGNNFVHRDLKPANILVARPAPDWWVKIADFGISKRAEEGSTACKTLIGTEGYCAPEVIGAIPSSKEKASDRSYTAAVDLWALGEVVYRMLAQRPAFQDAFSIFRFSEGQDTLEPQLQILSKRELSLDCLDFVERLLVVDPEARMAAPGALSHSWLEDDSSSTSSTTQSSPLDPGASPTDLATDHPYPLLAQEPGASVEAEASDVWSTVVIANDRKAIHSTEHGVMTSKIRGTENDAVHPASIEPLNPSVIALPKRIRDVGSWSTAILPEDTASDDRSNEAGTSHDSYHNERPDIIPVGESERGSDLSLAIDRSADKADVKDSLSAASHEVDRGRPIERQSLQARVESVSDRSDSPRGNTIPGLATPRKHSFANSRSASQSSNDSVNDGHDDNEFHKSLSAGDNKGSDDSAWDYDNHGSQRNVRTACASNSDHAEEDSSEAKEATRELRSYWIQDISRFWAEWWVIDSGCPTGGQACVWVRTSRFFCAASNCEESYSVSPDDGFVKFSECWAHVLAEHLHGYSPHGSFLAQAHLFVDRIWDDESGLLPPDLSEPLKPHVRRPGHIRKAATSPLLEEDMSSEESSAGERSVSPSTRLHSPAAAEAYIRAARQYVEQNIKNRPQTSARYSRFNMSDAGIAGEDSSDEERKRYRRYDETDAWISDTIASNRQPPPGKKYTYYTLDEDAGQPRTKLHGTYNRRLDPETVLYDSYGSGARYRERPLVGARESSYSSAYVPTPPMTKPPKTRATKLEDAEEWGVPKLPRVRSSEPDGVEGPPVTKYPKVRPVTLDDVQYSKYPTAYSKTTSAA